MKSNILIIMGSSRSKGNTYKIIAELQEKIAATFIDLKGYNISYYDYEHKNQTDDFLKLAEQMLQYDKIVFATPVYWYSMSAILKTFFDRLSDLLTIRKDIGRGLKGKTMYIIICSSDKEVYDGFEMPFERTAAYLDMHWGGSIHTWVGKEGIAASVRKDLDMFVEELKMEET